eukprot:896004-Rhodomonas_salina.1
MAGGSRLSSQSASSSDPDALFVKASKGEWEEWVAENAKEDAWEQRVELLPGAYICTAPGSC